MPTRREPTKAIHEGVPLITGNGNDFNWKNSATKRTLGW